MQCETFEIEEINASEASTMTADAEAIELAEKLGLTGQMKLVNKETLTRFPYPRLSISQEVVFRVLFPSVISAGEYRAGIIPLRALQVIAYCRDFPQTAYLEIWHGNVPSNDPILIGSPTQYTAEKYLLARWGDSLPSFDELKKQALPVIEAQFRAGMQSAINRIQGYLAAAQELAKIHVETGNKPSWSVYD